MNIMMTTFQNSSSLFAGDVLVAKKRKGLGRILNHYIVYVGFNTFVGNLFDGVKILSDRELMGLLQEYEPVSVRRFMGSYHQRNDAVNRAYSKLGERYSLLNFNCEHFANWVQFGKCESAQVKTGFTLLGSIILLKLFSSDE
jgi:uncharacterized protein YycO